MEENLIFAHLSTCTVRIMSFPKARTDYLLEYTVAFRIFLLVRPELYISFSILTAKVNRYTVSPNI